MTNIFISFLYIILSFQLFSLSYRISSINKIVSYIPKTIIENSVIITTDYNECYLERQLLIDNVELYLARAIINYTDGYETHYIFLDENNSVTTKDKPKGVLMSFECEVNYLYNYSKTITYTIKENHG